jgi:photosystem II stability/assembly factor-like uncharacterized protein
MNWQSVASSADGKKLVVVAVDDNMGDGGSIYTSTDSGANWTSNNVPLWNWQAVVSSADGTTLIAKIPGTVVYMSTDSGANWLPAVAPSFTTFACSTNAKTIVAANIGGGGFGGLIYTSTNTGSTWTTTAAPAGNWTSVACSADGKKNDCRV